MARGWESKSVEAQIEAAENPEHGRGTISERDKKKEGLLLTRVRVARDLETARNARHRRILEQALEHLDREIALLKQTARSEK